MTYHLIPTQCNFNLTLRSDFLLTPPQINNHGTFTPISMHCTRMSQHDIHHSILITDKVPYLVIVGHKLDDKTPPVMDNLLSSWNLEVTHEHIQHPKVGPSHTTWFKENPDHLMNGKHKTHLHVFKSTPSVQPSWLTTSTRCVTLSSNQNRRPLHKIF